MTQRSHKIITAILLDLVVLGEFAALLYIVNLNQIAIYLQTALVVWVILCLFIVLSYDLHFKNPGSWQRAKLRHEGIAHRALRFCRILATAFWDRIRHLRSWEALTAWINYLLLPGFIFWGTVILFFVNFNFYKFQYIVFFLSSFALVVNYWYLKEIFYRKREIVDRDIFVRLAVVKIYASAVVFAAALAVVRYYCLDWPYLVIAIFCMTFLLIYQALFQHRLLNWKNFLWTVAIAVVMAVISYGILIFWGYNYYTAAIFMTICYNLMWGTFHYHLDKALTKEAFYEILIISILLAFMVLSITNFKARILDAC